jgi:hypothetical protein
MEAQLDPAEQDALRRYAHALSQRRAAAAASEHHGVDSGLAASELSAGRLLWITHLCLLGLAFAAILACSVYLSFILVPLAVSYFLTFLLQPVVRLLTQRPLVCCGRPVCAELMRRNMLRANRDRLESTAVDPASESSAKALSAAAKQCGLDLLLLGRLPHTAAVLLTLALALGVVYAIAYLLVVDVADAWNQAPGHYLLPPPPPHWEGQGEDGGAVGVDVDGIGPPWEQDLYGAFSMWHRGAIELIEADTGLRLTFELGDLAEGMGYNRTLGWSLASLEQGASLLTAIMNYVFIVLLLATYLLVGGGGGGGGGGAGAAGGARAAQLGGLAMAAEQQHSHARPAAAANAAGVSTAELVQQTLRDYVGTRTRCALLIGFGSWFILSRHVCGVLLAFVWGFLIFVLAFVPFIGPAVSCLLPLPFIMLDRSLNRREMWIATLAPSLLHVVVHRLLEPALALLWFGKPATSQPQPHPARGGGGGGGGAGGGGGGGGGGICAGYNQQRKLNDVHPVISLVAGEEILYSQLYTRAVRTRACSRIAVHITHLLKGRVLTNPSCDRLLHWQS